MLKTITLIGLIMLSAAGFAGAQSGGDAEFTRLNAELFQSYAAGDYGKALAAAEKLLAMATRLDGKDSFSVGKVLRNRGMVEKAKVDLEAAEKTFDAAINIYKKQNDLSKKDAAGLADMLEALGVIRSRDRLMFTEGIFREALALREKTHGADSPQTATPLVHLANIKFWRRDYKESSELYTRALRNLMTEPSSSNEDVLFVYYRTECSYRKAKIEDKFATIKARYEAAAEFKPGEPRRARLIQGGVLNGKARLLGKPSWPAEARSSPTTQGSVEVEVLIDEGGQVISRSEERRVGKECRRGW